MPFKIEAGRAFPMQPCRGGKVELEAFEAIGRSNQRLEHQLEKQQH